jgi:hypothetical protein
VKTVIRFHSIRPIRPRDRERRGYAITTRTSRSAALSFSALDVKAKKGTSATSAFEI